MKTVLVIMLLKVSVGNGCEIHVQRTTGQLLVTACSHNCPDSSSHLAGPYHLLSCGELPVRTQSSHPDTVRLPSLCLLSLRENDIFAGCNSGPRYGPGYS